MPLPDMTEALCVMDALVCANNAKSFHEYRIYIVFTAMFLYTVVKVVCI